MPYSRSTAPLLWGSRALMFCLLLATTTTAWGQAKKGEPAKLPKPIDAVVTTDDYVDLHYTFYPSPLEDGKKAVPIVLIHGWEGRRTELDPLAKFLQDAGHAVMVPDLRGHGDSNIRKIAGRPAEDLKPEDLTRSDLILMATTDFLLLKKDLLTRNNNAELNIKLLTLVGIDVGTVVAENWAAVDYSRVDLPTITLGRDVKALVLISPNQGYKDMKNTAALKNAYVLKALSVMIIGGANDQATSVEMKRLQNLFAKYHPVPKKLAAETQAEYQARLLKEKDFWPEFEATTLQGVKLISAPRPLNVATKIAAFIQLRIADRADAKDLPAWEGDRRLNEPAP